MESPDVITMVYRALTLALCRGERPARVRFAEGLLAKIPEVEIRILKKRGELEVTTDRGVRGLFKVDVKP